MYFADLGRAEITNYTIATLADHADGSSANPYSIMTITRPAEMPGNPLFPPACLLTPSFLK